MNDLITVLFDAMRSYEREHNCVVMIIAKDYRTGATTLVTNCGDYNYNSDMIVAGAVALNDSIEKRNT